MTKFLREKGFVILLLSIIFTLGSLFWTSDVVSGQGDLNRVDLGWPIHFITQDYSQLTPPESWFPNNLKFGLPQEYPTSIHFLPFIFDTAINFLIIFGSIFIILEFNLNVHFLRKILRVKYIVGVVGLVFLILISYVVFTEVRNKLQRGIGTPPDVAENIGIVPYILWEEVLDSLRNGQVKRIMQAHNLDVTFVFKDGNVFKSKEPYIDEIFKEIERCGKICRNIGIATE